MPATILIVDDERNIQLTLARALTLEGYAAETASGGQEALEKIAAFDYLEKPITEREKLLVTVRNALAMRNLAEENAALRREAGRFDMVGSGPAMERLFELVRRTAANGGGVLVPGG